MPDDLPAPLVFPIALSEVRRGLEATDAAATMLLQGLEDRSANWQPVALQSWSIAQCVDHLTVTAAVYGEAIAEALAGAPRVSVADPTIAPGRPSEWFVRQIEPPPKRRTKTQAKLAPVAHRAPADVLERFLAGNRDLQQLIDRVGAVELNRVRFRNPLVPLLRFTVGTGVVILLAHHRRHLWQAYRVRDAAGFPG